MSVEQRRQMSQVQKSLMGIASIVKSLGIEKMNVDPWKNGDQTRQAIHLRKVTLTIGIRTQGIVVLSRVWTYS